MKKYLSLIFGFLLCGNSLSQTVAPIQSPARPYNLDIVNPVMVTGSDARSAEFNNTLLKSYQDFVKTNLPEFKNNTTFVKSNDVGSVNLDYNASMRCYFITENAAWSNSIGIYSTNNGKVTDILKSDAELIFPDASTSNVRTLGNPLQPGDFVDLGEYTKGDTFDFFLIAKGATNPGHIYSTDTSLNNDGLVHSFTYSDKGSTYILYTFEDVHGLGDKDYNDIAFVLEFKGINAPEPSMAVMGCLVVCGSLLRRKREDLI